jgi:hypothetical protein
VPKKKHGLWRYIEQRPRSAAVAGRALSTITPDGVSATKEVAPRFFTALRSLIAIISRQQIHKFMLQKINVRQQFTC